MPAKILSVDDSKMIHTIIGKAFKNYDVQLIFGSNGVEGLAAASREKPDVIILDVTMPVMDGVECLTKLKADPHLKDIPVIMLTAEAGKENVIKIARIGVRDYIIKPFTEQLVVERVGRIIDLQAKGAVGAKTKTLADPILLLVVDDKPAIIEQVKEIFSAYPWRIIGTSQCGEAIDISSRELPDAIIVSLSLPDKAAHNFFQMMRANTKTKSVPVFGMSVKTALEEQSQAQSIGFTGIITKPLDPSEIIFRLCKSMNLDTSARYFTQEGTTMTMKLPSSISDLVASEIFSFIQPKTRDMVDAGLVKMLLDASACSKIDMVIIKIILGVVQACRELGIKLRIVGNPEISKQSRQFEETQELQFFESREAALEGM
jgi:two-component system cell cycle response regulator